MILDAHKKFYRFWFDMWLRGRDVTIGVREVNCIKPFNGNPYHCDSDIDFFGEIDAVFDILNKKGTLTHFQQDHLDWTEWERIADAIYEVLEGQDYEPN